MNNVSNMKTVSHANGKNGQRSVQVSMNLVGPSTQKIHAPLSPGLIGSSLLDSQESSNGDGDDYDGEPGQIAPMPPLSPSQRQLSNASN